MIRLHSGQFCFQPSLLGSLDKSRRRCTSLQASTGDFCRCNKKLQLSLCFILRNAAPPSSFKNQINESAVSPHDYAESPMLFLPRLCRLSVLRLPPRTASGAAERLHIQGRHVSEEMYLQRDDSEPEECGRGCTQHDPSGSVPPHVIPHYSGSRGLRARPYYNRQGHGIHSQAAARMRSCNTWRPFANMQALHIRMKPAARAPLRWRGTGMLPTEAEKAEAAHCKRLLPFIKKQPCTEAPSRI